MIIITIFIILVGVIIPIRLAFLNYEDNKLIWYYFDIFFDIYFGVDLILNFLTAYYKNNTNSGDN